MVSHEALPGVSMGIANRGWCGSFTILGDSKVITLYKNKIHCRCRKTGLAILYCPLRLNSPFGDMHELALTGQVVKESGASACHAHGWTGDKESQPRGFSYHGVWTTSSNITDYRAEAPGATPDRMTPACGGVMLRSFHWMWLGFLKEVGGDVLRDLWRRRNNLRTRGTWLGFGIVLARMGATIASL